MRALLVRAIESACTSDALEAKDGDEALQLCEENEFGLITLDWDMPGKNGLEVLRAIRGNGSRAPVFMVPSHQPWKPEA